MKISEKKRIVIKLGTSTLTHKTGKLNIRRMTDLVRIISDLHNSGKDIIIVSSGAIGMGVGKLNLRKRPKDTPSKQACAAVGQSELMHVYDEMFEKYSATVAQILVTKRIMHPDNLVNVQNTINTLLKYDTIPIVNENDTVAVDELEFEIGENDSLAAMVAEVAEADLLVILTDIDGLYTDDPRKNPNAKLVHVVENIDDRLEAMAGDSGTALGTGGMATKINAAKIATNAGIDMVILNGRKPELLYDLFDDIPDVGTIFKAKAK